MRLAFAALPGRPRRLRRRRAGRAAAAQRRAGRPLRRRRRLRADPQPGRGRAAARRLAAAAPAGGAAARAGCPDGRFERIPGEPRLRNVVAVVPGHAAGAGRRRALRHARQAEGLRRRQQRRGRARRSSSSSRSAAARAQRPDGAPELRFVLFDGEEPARGPARGVRPTSTTTGLRGSRAYVKRHARRGRRDGPARLRRRQGPAAPARGDVDASRCGRRSARRPATRARRGQFPDGTGPAITDDHTPFLRAGIPAVDLIDWSYPGHSLEDGMDLLSVDSVDAVGETLVRFVDTWRP